MQKLTANSGPLRFARGFAYTQAHRIRWHLCSQTFQGIGREGTRRILGDLEDVKTPLMGEELGREYN
jgi:hypothetical protein